MERSGFVFWQKDIETMSRAEIRALQLKKLQHTVKWSYDRVPYYHKIMEEAGKYGAYELLYPAYERLQDVQFDWHDFDH